MEHSDVFNHRYLLEHFAELPEAENTVSESA